MWVEVCGIVGMVLVLWGVGIVAGEVIPWVYVWVEVLLVVEEPRVLVLL